MQQRLLRGIKNVNPNLNTTSRSRSLTFTLVAAMASVAVLIQLGATASAGPDPVARAAAALRESTAVRVAAEKRIGDIRTQVRDLEMQLTKMTADDEKLTEDLAVAKNAMREYAISAYIAGRGANVVSMALDPTDVEELMWKSTLAVGQAASADEAARRYSELKTAATPARLRTARDLEQARRALVDANNDAIQAAAIERDNEAKLALEREAARRRAQEAVAREREAAAARQRASAGAESDRGSSRSVSDPGGSDSQRSNKVDPAEVPLAARGNPSPAESAKLAKIRRCESGGNYRAVSSTGRYRGAYQFDFRTWGGTGGSGDPAEASPAEQDYRALLLLRSRGTRPWPVCGR